MKIRTTIAMMSLLAASSLGVGCAELPDSSRGLRRNNELGESSGTATDNNTAEQPKSSAKVNGQVSSAGDGTVGQGLGGSELLTVGKTIQVMALGEKGELTPVGNETEITPGGGFNADLPPNASPTGIFIIQVKNLFGAVVGSGVVNGLPAFVKGFVVDAVVDTVTSFKAEILVTLAKKGVPGVQNYLNVINAYVDAQLANSIALVGVLTTDLTTLIGAAADAVIAAENVIVSLLNKAGIPIDISKLTAAQSAAVSGVQGLVTNATGRLVTGAKDLVAALKAASAKAAAPIDKLIFNAIVNGGALFGSGMKNGAPSTIGLAASKSVFQLESDLATDSILDMFKGSGATEKILDAVTKACADLHAHIAQAKSLGDLSLAKGQFKDVLLGKNDTPNGILQLLAKAVANLKAVIEQVDATFAPLTQNLANAFATLDSANMDEALKQLDEGTQSVPASLKKALSDNDAEAIASALTLIEKAVVQ